MSLEGRFSEEEQFLLSSTTSLIGSAMAFAEGSGLGTIKEMMASAKSLMAGVKDFPNNEIINGILPNLEDRKEAMADAKVFRKKALARLKDKGINSHEQMSVQVIEDCQAVMRLLDEKASAEEKEEYKAWAMSIAENVAKAAKEGGFLGIGGVRVSDGEKEMYTKIAAALGTTSQIT